MLHSAALLKNVHGNVPSRDFSEELSTQPLKHHVALSLTQGAFKGQERCIFTNDLGYLECVVRFTQCVRPFSFASTVRYGLALLDLSSISSV